MFQLYLLRGDHNHYRTMVVVFPGENLQMAIERMGMTMEQMIPRGIVAPMIEYEFSREFREAIMGGVATAFLYRRGLQRVKKSSIIRRELGKILVWVIDNFGQQEKVREPERRKY